MTGKFVDRDELDETLLQPLGIKMNAAKGMSPRYRLSKAFAASRIIEALKNYSLADGPLQLAAMENAKLARTRKCDELLDDEAFWSRRIARVTNKRRGNDLQIHIKYATLTEWVARVPGLAWHPKSIDLRSEIEPLVMTGLGLETMMVVSVGFGTLRFPASNDGYRLVTLTKRRNASMGVPVLISPDTWKSHKLREGCKISGRATVRELPLTWAGHFPVVAGIPRVCLVLDRPSDITECDSSFDPVEIHPFSMMEYWNDQYQLHDFVYAAVETSPKGLSRKVATFFESVRKSWEGVYLTAADMVDPMWDSVFSGPEDMRLHKSEASKLLELRLEDFMNGRSTTEALLASLSTMETKDLIRISTDAEINWRKWSKGGLVAEEASRLVATANEAGKISALLYAVQSEK